MSAISLSLNDKGVARVTLTRPQQHNAFDDSIIAELTDAFEQVESNDDARLMVLDAQGKSFSAGADLNWMQRMASYTHAENLADAQRLATMLNTLDRLSKPTLARVQGAAYGGAVGLVSCCDIAVGTPAATFCLSEVKIGLVPATISPYVIAAIGQRASRRYFQTAEVIEADTAHSLGLLSSVVDVDKLDAEVERFCTMLLSNGTQAMQQSKELIFNVANKPVSEELRGHTSEIIARARVSEEGQQRLSAFFDKRAHRQTKPETK